MPRGKEFPPCKKCGVRHAPGPCPGEVAPKPGRDIDEIAQDFYDLFDEEKTSEIFENRALAILAYLRQISKQDLQTVIFHVAVRQDLINLIDHLLDNDYFAAAEEVAELTGLKSDEQVKESAAVTVLHCLRGEQALKLKPKREANKGEEWAKTQAELSAAAEADIDDERPIHAKKSLAKNNDIILEAAKIIAYFGVEPEVAKSRALEAIERYLTDRKEDESNEPEPGAAQALSIMRHFKISAAEIYAEVKKTIDDFLKLDNLPIKPAELSELTGLAVEEIKNAGLELLKTRASSNIKHGSYHGNFETDISFIFSTYELSPEQCFAIIEPLLEPILAEFEKWNQQITSVEQAKAVERAVYKFGSFIEDCESAFGAKALDGIFKRLIDQLFRLKQQAERAHTELSGGGSDRGGHVEGENTLNEQLIKKLLTSGEGLAAAEEIRRNPGTVIKEEWKDGARICLLNYTSRSLIDAAERMAEVFGLSLVDILSDPNYQPAVEEGIKNALDRHRKDLAEKLIKLAKLDIKQLRGKSEFSALFNK